VLVVEPGEDVEERRFAAAVAADDADDGARLDLEAQVLEQHSPAPSSSSSSSSSSSPVYVSSA
jgi:hypothetical protein